MAAAPRRAGAGPVVPSVSGVPVHDVLFVLLILGLFALVAICAKGAEKL
jgi:hypothetical protein